MSTQNNFNRQENKPFGLVIHSPEFGKSEALKAGAATTYLAGTLVARDAADEKLVHYIPGDGTAGTIIGVLCEECEHDGVNDLRVEPLISGCVREQDLVVHGLTRAINKLELDALRDMTIIAKKTKQLANQDN